MDTTTAITLNAIVTAQFDNLLMFFKTMQLWLDFAVPTAECVLTPQKGYHKNGS